MTEETNDTASAVQENATQNVEAPAADTQAASPLVGEKVETPRTLTADEHANAVDAAVGEIKRVFSLAKLKPADAETLVKAANGAIKLTIEERISDLSDAKVAASLKRRRKNVDAQLANIKAFAKEEARQRVWQTVNTVLARLEGFALKTITYALPA